MARKKKKPKDCVEQELPFPEDPPEPKKPADAG